MRAFIREIIETTILAMLLFVALQFAVQSFQVEGVSMHPTLMQGNYLLVNKLVYRHITIDGGYAYADPEALPPSTANIFPFDPPKPGEVVVFNAPSDISRDFVKRVIGVPGDTVEIRRGRVFVNGAMLNEPYIKDEERDDDDMPPFDVPAAAFFVLGDNRRASNDSRDWGAVPLENIIGRAWVRYWPLSDLRVFPTADANFAADSER